jgi:hypothetical protein
MPSGVDLDRLLALEPERRIRGRNSTKADLLFYRLDDLGVALKTYAQRPAVIRWFLGRWLIARETAVYRAAVGVAGLPRFLGRLSSCALATEWVPARSLSELRGQGVDEAVFDVVGELLDRLHDRGIAVADLHHRDVLLAEDGSVYLVDLASAWLLGSRPGRIRRMIFDRLSDLDRIALGRMRARWTGRDEKEAIAAVGGPTAVWHARGRGVKATLDRLRGKSRN